MVDNFPMSQVEKDFLGITGDVGSDPTAIGTINTEALNQPASASRLQTIQAAKPSGNITPVEEAFLNNKPLPTVDETKQTPATESVQEAVQPTWQATSAQTTTKSPVDYSPMRAAAETAKTAEIKEFEAKKPFMEQADQQLQLLDEQHSKWAKYEELKAKQDAEMRKRELERYNIAADEYKNRALENRGFWAVSSTPQKISTALNLVSAALYSVARQPDRANKVIEAANKQMDDAINTDMNTQKEQLARAKEALGTQYNMMKDKFQLVRDENLDQQARKKGMLEAITTRLNSLKAQAESKGLQTAGIDKIIAKYEAQKAEIGVQEQKDNQSTTVTASQVVVPQARDLVGKLRSMKMEDAQKVVIAEQDMAKKAMDDKNVARHINMEQTRAAMDKFEKDPRGASLQVGKFIAQDLNQNSFNPDLAQMLFNESVPSRALAKWNALIGKDGVIPAATMKTLRAYLDNNLQTDRENPGLATAIDAAKKHQFRAAAYAAALESAHPSGAQNKKGVSSWQSATK